MSNVLESQPINALAAEDSARESLVVSGATVDGGWRPISRFGDMVWRMTDITPNVPLSGSVMDFNKVPESFRSTMKLVMYRYLRVGSHGTAAVSGRTAVAFFYQSLRFIDHLSALGLHSFAQAVSSPVKHRVQK